jgi:hypothetical protein
MGILFEKLCKGPVVVVDDRIGDEKDLINKLIGEIKVNKLPVLCYKSLHEVKNELPGILFSNFVVLDWKFGGEGEPTIGVITGDAGETITEQEVIEFIKQLKQICLAPIFILSAFNKDWILSKLRDAGIATGEKSYVFVENKDVLCETPGKLISTVEKWIADSPHVYLGKCWSNEWLTKNTMIFWALYELHPNWPALFYRAFEQEEDPILALRDALFQLVFSEIDVSQVDPSLLTKEAKEKYEGTRSESLKELYRRLVYLNKDIDKDIRPGDVFKRGGSYYLNICPECDTTRRTPEPKIYLLKGESRTPEEVKKSSYSPPYGIIDKEAEITMLLLDGNPFVVFNKRKLSIEKYSEWKNDKICRVASPFITRIRQSYSSYLGRFGVPSYPEQILKSLFESAEESTPA